MKLQVYEATTKKEEIVRLKLEDDGDGNITLCAVSGEGNVVYCGALLRFKSNGTILRLAAVSDEIGFALDDGRIKFEDY
jgi:hypothetical protein